MSIYTDNEASNGKSSVHEDQIDPTLPATQNTSENEHCDQPAEGDEENEADDQKETEQEQKHKVDQSQKRDNSDKEVNAVHSQQQQQADTDQDERQHEGETSRDSAGPEDTEQVETFFSTMSHRYENATQEGHIL